jgi:hypothetical protein
VTDGGKGYPTGEDLYDVFAQVLVLNTTKSSTGEEFHAVDFQWYFHAYFIMALEELRAAGKDFTALRSKWLDEYIDLEQRTRGYSGNAEFSHRIINACIGRKPFRTQQGYIGLGPHIARHGDIVCVLLGAHVPFILRPVGDQYQLLGECYVHGIMDGEALEEGRTRCQTFEIM